MYDEYILECAMYSYNFFRFSLFRHLQSIFQNMVLPINLCIYAGNLFYFIWRAEERWMNESSGGKYVFVFAWHIWFYPGRIPYFFYRISFFVLNLLRIFIQWFFITRNVRTAAIRNWFQRTYSRGSTLLGRNGLNRVV